MGVSTNEIFQKNDYSGPYRGAGQCAGSPKDDHEKGLE